MEWFLATLAAALIWSATGIVAKELMDQDSSLVYSFLYSTLALVFYTPVFLYLVSSAEISLSFFTVGAFIVSGFANIFGITAYNYSIKLGELSRVIPFTKLNPVFTAIIAAALLGEKMTPTRVTGILLVTVGSYVILEEKNRNWRQPFRSFIKDRAPKVAVLSAVIFSVAAVMDRYAVQAFQPEVYTFMIYLFMTTGLSVYIFGQRPELVDQIIPDLKKHRLKYVFTGAGAALASYLIFFAFSKAPASQVIPVLQIQVLISVIAGVLLFEEDNLKQKLIGSAILIAGVVLVAL
jgi:drug/metabolite transporter (DMT)-like permease